MTKKKLLALKPKLDALVEQIEQTDFIDNDPIQFMYAFEDKNDKELAGFFAAISAKIHHPKASVSLFEKTSKVLAKVKVSGGGRCVDVQNAQAEVVPSSCTHRCAEPCGAPGDGL